MIHLIEMLKKTLLQSVFDYCLILHGGCSTYQEYCWQHVRKSSLLLEKLHHFEIRATVTQLKNVVKSIGSLRSVVYGGVFVPEFPHHISNCSFPSCLS